MSLAPAQPRAIGTPPPKSRGELLNSLIPTLDGLEGPAHAIIVAFTSWQICTAISYRGWTTAPATSLTASAGRNRLRLRPAVPALHSEAAPPPFVAAVREGWQEIWSRPWLRRQRAREPDLVRDPPEQRRAGGRPGVAAREHNPLVALLQQALPTGAAGAGRLIGLPGGAGAQVREHREYSPMVVGRFVDVEFLEDVLDVRFDGLGLR